MKLNVWDEMQKKIHNGLIIERTKRDRQKQNRQKNTKIWMKYETFYDTSK